MGLSASSLSELIKYNLESYGFVANEHGGMELLPRAITGVVVSDIKSSTEVQVMNDGSLYSRNNESIMMLIEKLI